LIFRGFAILGVY